MNCRSRSCRRWITAAGCVLAEDKYAHVCRTRDLHEPLGSAAGRADRLSERGARTLALPGVT